MWSVRRQCLVRMHIVPLRMVDFGRNLHELMARFGLTVRSLAERSRLDERTIRGILNHEIGRPHARTLNKLAAGLGVEVRELFDAEVQHRRQFDRATNPVVAEAIQQRPEVFEGWQEPDFDELYSQFGAGGELTLSGALESAKAMNRKREVMTKLAVVLESSEAELMSQIVEAFFQRVVVAVPDDLESGSDPR